MPTREALRNRRRRIIWNNDGDDLLTTANYNSPGNELSKKEFAPFITHFPKRFEKLDNFS